jgi:hypothetical protein
MMRTVEAILVIGILASTFAIGSFFAVLPLPRQISSVNLEELALTTLQMLNQDNELNQIVFNKTSDASWGYLQTALTASLPPNILYNFTVYSLTSSGQYNPNYSFSNTKTGLGTSSKTASIIVPSSNITFSFTPQKIPTTLYILNCSDANGWWITGYTGQTLASNLQSMLSPYFNRTVMVQTTAQLGKILNGSALQGEIVKNATVINTFGEAVPIPAGYYNKTGYDKTHQSYANYTYTLGLRVNAYNWTWISIVGYPFYYATNIGISPFKATDNTWGIYGMKLIGQSGLNAFLQGISKKRYNYTSTDIKKEVGVVSFTTSANYTQNYYGVYPGGSQTATRALDYAILAQYDLNISSTLGKIFNWVNQGGKTWIPAATYNHEEGGVIRGSFTAIGLTRTPDIRVTALALLMFYHPTLYPSASTSSGSTRLVVLQLGLQGGG